MTFAVKSETQIRPMLINIGRAIVGMLAGGPVEIVLQRISKSRAQENKYHTMISCFTSVELFGRTYNEETWKAVLVDDFENVELVAIGETLAHPGQTVPSLDGRRAVTIRASTAKFRKREAGDFIAYLYARGVDYGVTFSDPAIAVYEEEMRRRELSV
jgi:hypothetical protein